MALNAATLATQILTEMTNRGFIIAPGVQDGIPWQTLFAEAIATAIVTHIQANSELVETPVIGTAIHAHLPGKII